MKKQLPCLLLALTIVNINLSPVQAANKSKKSSTTAKKQFVVPPGKWCFQLPRMGYFCYDFQ